MRGLGRAHGCCPGRRECEGPRSCGRPACCARPSPVRTARGSLLPRLDGYASWAGSGSTFSDRNGDRTYGLVASIDLLDPGKFARVAEARAQRQAATAMADAAADAVAMEIVSAYYQLRSAQQRVEVATRSAALAAEAARIVGDLVAPTYKVDSSGRLVVEQKAETKPSPLTPAPAEFPSGIAKPPPFEYDKLLGDIAALRSRAWCSDAILRGGGAGGAGSVDARSTLCDATRRMRGRCDAGGGQPAARAEHAPPKACSEASRRRG